MKKKNKKKKSKAKKGKKVKKAKKGKKGKKSLGRHHKKHHALLHKKSRSIKIFLLSNKFKFTIIVIDIRHPLIIVNNRSIQGFFHKRDIVINRSFSHREFGCQLFWASCNLLVDKAV